MTQRPPTARGALSGWRPLVLMALALLSVMGVGLFAWRSGTNLEDLALLGYPGVFAVMVIAGAGTFFPMPGQAAVLVAGALWNPVLVGIAAGLGNATGELLGYAAGRAGGAALEGRRTPRWLALFQSWLRRYGFFAILAIAIVPNPIFDVVGLLAGSLGYPARRFWIATAMGNCLKYAGYAFLGDAAKAFWG